MLQLHYNWKGQQVRDRLRAKAYSLLDLSLLWTLEHQHHSWSWSFESWSQRWNTELMDPWNQLKPRATQFFPLWIMPHREVTVITNYLISCTVIETKGISTRDEILLFEKLTGRTCQYYKLLETMAFNETDLGYTALKETCMQFGYCWWSELAAFSTTELEMVF